MYQENAVTDQIQQEANETAADLLAAIVANKQISDGNIPVKCEPPKNKP